MNKIVQYLNQHIRGEATADTPVLRAVSTDNSVLTSKPELVVFPHNTNDIRKVARFATQLAEKKHILPLTARGFGNGNSGGAIGTGAVINLTAHMNQVMEFDPKQKQVRLQPGASVHTMQQTLALQGHSVAGLPQDGLSSLGGLIATGDYVMATPKSPVDRLEVVLASGDVIQTERISKRELNKRIGKTNTEGDIYRQVDRLIDDNKELINKELSGDNTGYAALSRVKRKDGSIDLTPLFVGSGGTLGIISEMILHTDFASFELSQVVMAFASDEAARDMLDDIRKIGPTKLQYFDGEMFDVAASQGAKYPAYSDMNEKGEVGAVVYVSFEDFSDRARSRKVKRLLKLVEAKDGVKVAHDETHSSSELEAVLSVGVYGRTVEPRQNSLVPLLEGIQIPVVQAENFIGSLRKLSEKMLTPLPISIQAIDGIYSIKPGLQLSKIGDRQKVFKIIAAVTELVNTYDGKMFARSNEGRMFGPIIDKTASAEVIDLYTKLRDIFDPHHVLNPGVKQQLPLKDLVGMLRNEYDITGDITHLPGSYR